MLSKPNPYQNESNFLKSIIIQHLLHGRCYINKFTAVGFKIPSYLYLLPPQYTKIIFEQMQYDITVPEQIRQKAKRALDSMVKTLPIK